MTTPAPVKPKKDPSTPGYATTEFWMSAVIPTLFLLFSQFNIFHIDTNNPHVEEGAKIGSYVLAAAGYGFYAHSRGKMKLGASIWAGLQDLGGLLVHSANTISETRRATTENLLTTQVAQISGDDALRWIEMSEDDIAHFVEMLLAKVGIKPDPAPQPDNPAPSPDNPVPPVQSDPSLPDPEPNAVTAAPAQP